MPCAENFAPKWCELCRNGSLTPDDNSPTTPRCRRPTGQRYFKNNSTSDSSAKSALAVQVEIEDQLLAAAFRERAAPLLSVRSLWEKDQRLRDSVFATVENVLAPYASTAVGGVSVDCDIDFSEWLSGDNTIYVVATSHDQNRFRPVLTTFVQQAIRTAFDAAMRNGGTLERACLVMLDEAGLRHHGSRRRPSRPLRRPHLAAAFRYQRHGR